MIESKLQINNLSQLKAHLADHKIDYSKWELKNVSDLLKEIEQGDCQLWVSQGEHQQESKLTRKVKVGYCHISCKGKWIKELRQEWQNGIIKERMQPVAGKLNTALPTKEEMAREIVEELSLPCTILPVIKASLAVKETTTKYGDSPFYPGLPAVWDATVFEWQMPEEFWSEEYVEKQDNKITRFGWVDHPPAIAL